MGALLGQFLYNLLSSTVFWVILGFWVIVLIAWGKPRKKVFERIWLLVKKPHIFEVDKDPENVPLYPRTIFEKVSVAIKDTLKNPFSTALKGLSNWIKSSLHPLIYDPKHPFRMPATLLFLAVFILFVVADVIAVANTLALLDLFSGDLSGILGSYDLAVLAGSLAALIIGFIITFELFEKESIFTDLSEKPDAAKGLYRGFSLLVALLAIFSLITWALARMIELGYVNETTFTTNLVQWVLYGVVPINSAFAASMVFIYAFKGILVLFTALCWVITAILWILNYIATIIGVVVPFSFDILYRLIYILIDILLWIIATPIIAILMPFIVIFRMINPQKESPPAKD